MGNLFRQRLIEVMVWQSERKMNKKSVNIVSDGILEVVMDWQLGFLALPVQTNRWQTRLAWFRHQMALQYTC